MSFRKKVTQFIIFVFPLVIFWKSFFVYFVQDDFFLLSVSQAKTLQDFFSFFIPLKETVWYRPLSSQVFFFLSQVLFGLNPILFHLVVFITHIATSLLLFKLVFDVTKKRPIAILSSIFYSIYWIHVVSLSWLAAYSFVLGPFFLISALLQYKNKKYYLSWVLFFLGVLTAEVLIFLPIIFFFYDYFFRKKIVITRLFFFLIVSIAVYIFRIIIFPTDISSDLYSISLSVEIINTARFYFFRLLGLPLLIRTMPNTLKFTVYSLSVTFISVLLIGIKLFFKGSRKETKTIVFFIILFLIGIFLFLLLSSHISPHYLSFALLGIAPLFAIFTHITVSKLAKGKDVLYGVIVTVFISLQIINTFWMYKTHWIFKRAKIAQSLVAKKEFKHAPGTEEYFSLGADSAYELFEKTTN